VRILICAQEAPFGPINGFRIQVAAVTAALAATNDVRMLAFLAPDQRGRLHLEGMRLIPVPLRVPAGGEMGSGRSRPWTAPGCYAPLADVLRVHLRDEIRTVAPDLVYVTGVRLAQLGRECGTLPRVVAPLDAAHLSFEAQAAAARSMTRPLLRAAARRVRRFEATEYRHFDRVLVLSARDRDALRVIAPALRVEVIPQPVDATAFAPRANAARDPRQIVFAGVLSAAANVTAAEFLARRVMPLVRAEVPDARLAIVGRTPPRRVRALGRLNGVHVVGEVTDMVAWLTGSRACAVPMLTGSGVKNKLLEGMASGLPCVATRRALGGLNAIPGRHLLVGETAEQFASHLVRILEDDRLAAMLGAAAREYVNVHHTRAVIAGELARVCAEVVTERTRRTALGSRLPQPGMEGQPAVNDQMGTSDVAG
jgi:glycosyltransferase involved in cell wall biosynthesis